MSVFRCELAKHLFGVESEEVLPEEHRNFLAEIESLTGKFGITAAEIQMIIVAVCKVSETICPAFTSKASAPELSKPEEVVSEAEAEIVETEEVNEKKSESDPVEE